MWRLSLCLCVLSQLSVVSLNGFQRPLPLSPDFSYAQGGADWGPACFSTIQQQTPVDISQSCTYYREVTEADSAFVPIRLRNAPIGDRFIPVDVSGTRNYYVFAGEALWNLTIEAPSTQILMEFHVIAPSEHTFNGYRYPLEVHLHYGLPRPAGLLMLTSVIAIWLDIGAENPVISQVIAGGNFDLRSLFPDSEVLDDYFYYTGTEDRPYPFCYADVGWVVPNYVLTASQSQIDYFNDMYMNNASFAGGRGNNRDVNPTHEPVYHFRSGNRAETQSFLSP